MSDTPELSPDEVTRLLTEMSEGRPGASDRLIPLVYDELRRLAQSFMRQERSDHTLQATALVHEAFMKLVEQRNVTWQNRAQFFAVAAQLMRRILVDHARRRNAAIRGGGKRVELEEVAAAAPERSIDLVALDEALAHLRELDERQSRIVEMKFFAGMEIEQIAEALSISPATVKRDWTLAKAWLLRELESRPRSPREAGSTT